MDQVFIMKEWWVDYFPIVRGRDIFWDTKRNVAIIDGQDEPRIHIKCVTSQGYVDPYTLILKMGPEAYDDYCGYEEGECAREVIELFVQQNGPKCFHHGWPVLCHDENIKPVQKMGTFPPNSREMMELTFTYGMD